MTPLVEGHLSKTIWDLVLTDTCTRELLHVTHSLKGSQKDFAQLHSHVLVNWGRPSPSGRLLGPWGPQGYNGEDAISIDCANGTRIVGFTTASYVGGFNWFEVRILHC